MAFLPFSLPVQGLPWKWIVGGVLALAVVLAILAYGESRADGREEKVNARWEAAAAALEESGGEAAGVAEEGAVEREQDYADRLKEEKERLDEAAEEGSDPFDVLFPSS